MTEYIEIIGEDYVHSSNSLFHFMTSPKYLTDALKRKALCPRYCNEDIEYLSIVRDGAAFNEVSVLQKCFCDIPLGNIIKRFPVKLIDNNSLSDEEMRCIPHEFSHPDFYGKYALAFSKKWGEINKLQPIHYLSNDADVVKQFSKMMCNVLQEENLPDSVSDALLNWMCYFKPLRGTMKRREEIDSKGKIEIEVYKNFHDEHEWRYVPYGVEVNGHPLDCLIANGAVQSGLLKAISDSFEEEEYRPIWLPFQYDEIKYIIVPNNAGRLEIIKTIHDLPEDKFEVGDIGLQKSILISKILMLDDVKKDF